MSHHGSDVRGHLGLNLIKDSSAAASYFQVLGSLNAAPKSELNTECIEEFNTGQGDYLKKYYKNINNNFKKKKRAVKPTERNVNVKSCWSLTTLGLGVWSTSPSWRTCPGRRGQLYFYPDGQVAELKRCGGKLRAQWCRESGREPGDLQVWGAPTHVGFLAWGPWWGLPKPPSGH